MVHRGVPDAALAALPLHRPPACQACSAQARLASSAGTTHGWHPPHVCQSPLASAPAACKLRLGGPSLAAPLPGPPPPPPPPTHTHPPTHPHTHTHTRTHTHTHTHTHTRPPARPPARPTPPHPTPPTPATAPPRLPAPAACRLHLAGPSRAAPLPDIPPRALPLLGKLELEFSALRSTLPVGWGAGARVRPAVLCVALRWAVPLCQVAPLYCCVGAFRPRSSGAPPGAAVLLACPAALGSSAPPPPPRPSLPLLSPRCVAPAAAAVQTLLCCRCSGTSE